MRVTQNMLTNSMMRNLSRSASSMDKYQNQLSTGKKISKPSDDPVVATRGMYYRSSLVEIGQFQKNALEASDWMNLTDTALGESNDLLHRTRELLVQASNDGVYSQEQLTAIAEEIHQMRNQMGDTANSNIGGRYIFAGTDNTNPPYDKVAGQWANQNNEAVRVEVNPKVSVDVNINGNKIFDTPAGNGVFKVLDDIIDRLKNGGTAPIDSYLDKVDEQMNNLISHRAALGARSNRIDLVKNRLDVMESSTTELLSNAEDADIAKVITDLKAQENVHRAALSAGARIIQPTLMDFLR